MNSPDPATDKFELHYRQQLCALMDGDLAPDQARFLLRRLQHDGELTAQWDRWQLLGDVLRGQAIAPAPAGFAERVAAAVAASPAVATAAAMAPERSRSRLLRWGGALAASVALVALFVARQQTTPSQTQPVAVATAEPAAVASPEAQTSLADAAPVVASVAPHPINAKATRRSATRNQQVARVAAARASKPQRATGTTDAAPAMPVMVAEARPHDPFSGAGIEAQSHVPGARPWPRSVLQGYPAGGAFSASYGGNSGAHDFHPFEPRPLPDSPPIELPAEAGPQD